MGHRGRHDFIPEAHEQQLAGIYRAVEALAEVDGAQLHRILARFPRSGRGMYSKPELISGVRHLAARFGWDAAAFADKLKRKPVRTESGVTPVTVLTRPHPCPGRCIFCPSDVRMPKSYLSMEPGAQRAAQHRFDPYAQTLSRLSAFHANGHRLDKVELIVLGGTWSAYPEAYRRWYVKRLFDALNDFGAVGPEASRPDPRLEPFAELEAGPGGYDEVVVTWLRARRGGRLAADFEDAGWDELEAAHRENEGARVRAVGLSLETRPDQVDEAEVRGMRRLGATKVQLGYQSLSDELLALNRRGHDVTASRRATRLLRRAGFKIQGHWMLNLFGATPESDQRDFERLFADPELRPDELKIYPCSLIESAELMHEHRRGAWRPYEEAELLELLAGCLSRVPEYCRVTRVIRDIPSHDIVVGNRRSNLRERAEAELARRGVLGRDIRAREIRGARVAPEALRLEVTSYAAGAGEERFLQLVTPDDRLAGFCRLSLPGEAPSLDELAGRAILREVHVYGQVASYGEASPGHAQHLGLGRRLIDEARARAAAGGYAGLAVISAVGTRGYYRKLGFVDGELYQHSAL